MTAAYSPSPTRRSRRIKAEIGAPEDAQVELAAEHRAVTLRGFCRDAIEQHLDQDALRLTKAVEEEERSGLAALMAHRDDGHDDDWNREW